MNTGVACAAPSSIASCPTEPQAVFLAGETQGSVLVYNAALLERTDAWETCCQSINYYDQGNQLKAMRADGCLTLSNFSCCQDVLRRIKKAFDSFRIVIFPLVSRIAAHILQVLLRLEACFSFHHDTQAMYWISLSSQV
jgi:hypothetical protein